MAKVNLLRVSPTNNDDDDNSSDVLNTDMFIKRAPVKLLSPKEDTDHNNAVNSTMHSNSAAEEAWQEEVVLNACFKKSLLHLNRSHDILNNYPLTKDEEKLASSRTLRLWRTLFRFMSLTSLHGLPHIMNTKKSCYRLTYWLILFLVAVGLMLWALVSVTMLYAENNTVLVSKQRFNKRLPFPAVTICNLNFYRRSVFTSANVTDLDDIVVFLNLVSQNAFLVNPDDLDWEEFFTNTGHLFEAENSIFYYNNSGHQIEDMLYQCRFAGIECSKENFTQISTTNGNCYVFNSGIDQPILYSDDGGYYSGLELILNAEEYEYFAAESDSVGFYISINDQDHFPYFGGIGGFSIPTGQLTQVALNKVDYKLLSSRGDCSDGFDLKYFKSYSRLSCIVECLTDIAVDICNCKPQFLPGPADVCKLTNDCWHINLTYDIEQCNCPFPCEFSTYEKKLSYAKFPAGHFTSLLNRSSFISMVPFPEFVISTFEGENDTYLNSNFTESFLTNNFVKLRVYYDYLVSTTMEEYLEYNTSQFIIDFLGYIGLFTGAGFLTFFEIVELCFSIIKPADDY